MQGLTDAAAAAANAAAAAAAPGVIDVPAVGATIVVGQPKIEGGTGGPNRVMALV